MVTAVASSQVSWWSVHTFVERLCNALNNAWPMVGTPAWCQFDDHDPAKWAALLDAAQHWALRLETCQEARAQVSRDVSSAPTGAESAQKWCSATTSTLSVRG